MYLPILFYWSLGRAFFTADKFWYQARYYHCQLQKSLIDNVCNARMIAALFLCVCVCMEVIASLIECDAVLVANIISSQFI
jgi:hypothetical protein